MNNTNITSISLGLQKKSFCIDGDESKIIYLDPSDLGIMERTKVFAEKTDELFKGLTDLEEDKVIEKLKESDSVLRGYVNELFDYDVCSVCVPSGTLFDAIGGVFKFEIIVNGLSKVYSDTISNEMQKVTDRVSKHTKKYTKKK